MSEKRGGMSGQIGGRHVRPESGFRYFRIDTKEQNDSDPSSEGQINEKKKNHGKLLKDLLGFLDTEGQEYLFECVRKKDLNRVRRIIKNLGRYLPDYAQMCEQINTQIFDDPDSIDWPAVEKNLGISK